MDTIQLFLVLQKDTYYRLISNKLATQNVLQKIQKQDEEQFIISPIINHLAQQKLMIYYYIPCTVCTVSPSDTTTLNINGPSIASLDISISTSIYKINLHPWTSPWALCASFKCYELALKTCSYKCHDKRYISC